MINPVKRVKEIEDDFKRDFALTESEIENYQTEIKMLSEILNWIKDEMGAIAEGSYDDETKLLKFNMKNRTRYCFEQFNFSLTTGDNTEIPIEIQLWRPGEEREIGMYHDFTQANHFDPYENVRLSADIDTLEFKILKGDPNAFSKDRKIKLGYSEAQGLLVRLRSFRKNVPDYDLKAKTRKIEKLTMAILDGAKRNPDQAHKTSKLTSVYLPALCRTMESYLQATKSGETKTTSDKRLEELHETIDISTTAFKNMNDSLHESTKAESEIDLKVMKEMMRNDGLI